MRDIVHNLAAYSIIQPATYSATYESVGIDLRRLNSALIQIHIGGGAPLTSTNKIEFKLVHADLNQNGEWPPVAEFEPVAQEDILGATVSPGGIVHSLTETPSAPSVFRAGYVGGRGKLVLIAVFSGTHSAGTRLAAILEGVPLDRPVAA